ncbi:DUF6435 family protein [Kiritimatiellota bacterium B12222]|nr:DUF6435 family protein [Kiritimatiellota bacterium B12222]
MKFFTKKTASDRYRDQYKSLMEQAMLAQRGGDIVLSAELHEKAEALLQQITKMEG